jgi:predicted RNA-binding Zn ribbon-like protein
MVSTGGDGRASSRLRVPGERAPGGLVLVQELVNTGLRVPSDEPRLADLLADPGSAGTWLAAALGEWAQAAGQPVPSLTLAAADLGPLREVREAIRALAAPGEAADVEPDLAGLASLPVALSVAPGGRVGYAPAAPGWRGVAALAGAEILLAQQRGQWPRFKTCPFPACGIAFYDVSRNASRVWHDVATCGNQTNLRAYRARRQDGTAR